MTHKEAIELKAFKHLCNCGGYAWTRNGRPQDQPHMSWCPQYTEYGEWWAALHSESKES